MAIIGSLIYGRNSSADAGDRTRANYIAEEGIEAIRNIRNAGYSNLTNGTYGLVQSGGSWTLSGSSDTNGIYTRSVTVAASGTNRKTVTSHVDWNGIGGGGQTDVVTELTNWMASLPKVWSNPSRYSTAPLATGVAGFRIATAGSYAYAVRNSSTGPNFFIINISNPSAPTISASLTIAGTPTNITVSGNYAYVSTSSSTAELQIVNVATPAAPTLAGTYNASGSAGGLGVFAVGTTVYLTRAANATNDEFVIINAANPSAPVRVAGYSLNVSMYEPFISGTVAYVATGSDTQEILVINMATPTSLTLGTSVNLAGTGDATSISGFGTALTVGQGTTLYTVNRATTLAPTVAGTLVLPGTVNDISVDSSRSYVFVGTNFTTGEFQVVNASTLATPSILSSVDLAGGAYSLTGVAYNATYDIVAGVHSNTASSAVILGPN
jgi:hypothetical protein